MTPVSVHRVINKNRSISPYRNTGEEDGGSVFIAFFGELKGSDVGGVAQGIGDGVRGVNGGRDEGLGDEKVMVLFPRIDSATDC